MRTRRTGTNRLRNRKRTRSIAPKRQATRNISSSRISIFGLRADHRKTKTAILISKQAIKLKNESKRNEVEQLIRQEVKKIPSHVELKKITYDKKGSPVKAIAEDGTELHVYLNNGIYFFREDKLTPHKNIEIKDEKSEAIDQVVTPPKKIKHQAYCLTPKSTKRREAKLRKKRLRKEKIRDISQNKAMVRPGLSEEKGSARAHVQAALLFTPPKKKKKRKKKTRVNHTDNSPRQSRVEASYEWAHLQSHSQGGPQDRNNLVVTTEPSNSFEIVHDGENRKLLKRGYSEVFVEVGADLVPDTHIAKKYTKTTKTTDFELEVDYKQGIDTPFGRSAPHISAEPYMAAVFEGLAKAHVPANKLNPAIAPAAVSAKGVKARVSLFFDKKPQPQNPTTPFSSPKKKR